MRAIAYVRVSTKRQEEKELSIPAQLREIRAFARMNEWEIVDEFADKARSGRESERPQLQAMLAALRAGRADVLIVWKLDRLARNALLSKLIRRELDEHGIRLVSLKEPTGKTPQEKLITHVFEGLAEFYSDNLSQDIKRGQREVARKGFYPFSQAPIGYKRVPAKDGTATRYLLVPDEAWGSVIGRIADEYASGRTGKQVADGLNADGLQIGTRRWTAKKIYYILKNPVYRGDTIIGARSGPPEDLEIIRETHEPLIDAATFDRIQAILAARTNDHSIARFETSPYLLSGLLRCGLCGRHMVGASAKSGAYRYYECQGRKQGGEEACRGIRVPKRKIEHAVLTEVRSLILDEANLSALVGLVNEELSGTRDRAIAEFEGAKKAVAAMRRKLQRNYEALESGLLDLEDLAPRIRKLREEIRLAERERDHREVLVQEQEAAAVTLESVLPYARKLRETLRIGSLRERKAFLAGLIARIVVRPEGVELEYRLPLDQARTEEVLSPVLTRVALGGGGGSRTRVRRCRRLASTSLDLCFGFGTDPPTGRIVRA